MDMKKAEKLGLVTNVLLKGLLIVLAYYFYTIGDMFISGLCLGWIIFEILAIIILAIAIVSAYLE